MNLIYLLDKSRRDFIENFGAYAMKKNRSSISKAGSYKEIGAYWDTHDLGEVWDKSKKVKFDVQIETEATY